MPSNAELFERLKAAHPKLTNLGLAGFALVDEAPDVKPENTACPACGVMLTEEHIPDE